MIDQGGLVVAVPAPHLDAAYLRLQLNDEPDVSFLTLEDAGLILVECFFVRQCNKTIIGPDREAHAKSLFAALAIVSQFVSVTPTILPSISTFVFSFQLQAYDVTEHGFRAETFLADAVRAKCSH